MTQTDFANGGYYFVPSSQALVLRLFIVQGKSPKEIVQELGLRQCSLMEAEREVVENLLPEQARRDAMTSASIISTRAVLDFRYVHPGGRIRGVPFFQEH
ncbi:hypothetical protein HY625_02755 [Candidatus Uhrbacteria bacterium]|nr:hypothetical protein [Candidatus Uhrbacteria bacterium]